MPGPGQDDEDDWAHEYDYDEDAKTKLDRAALPDEAIPERVEARNTGKYKTLSGYASADVQSELAFGRGVAHTTKRFLTGLRLRLIEAGTHPSVAEVQVEKFRQWMEDPDNAELVRVAMKG